MMDNAQPQAQSGQTATCAPVRIAVIGAGTITQSVHLPGLVRLAALFDLRMVCDISPTRATEVARLYGPNVRATCDPAEVLAADDVDAVLLATPGAHAELAGAALSAGKHVLAEKPLCLTAREAKELAAQAERAGRVLQVGYMKMYDPIIEMANLQLAQLDQPRLVRISVLHPADWPQVKHIRMTTHDDFDPATLTPHLDYEEYRITEALGDVPKPFRNYYRDVLCGSVIHELSVLRALGIQLPRSFEHVTVWPWPVDNEPPCLLAVGQVGAGTELVLSWNWLPGYPEYSEEVAVFAANGRIRISMSAPYLLEERSCMRSERAEGDMRADTTFFGGRDSGFVRQLEEFAACARQGSRPRSDATGAAEDLGCLQALVAALASGFGVTLGGKTGGSA
jgi:predicted dehydrogenase